MNTKCLFLFMFACIAFGEASDVLKSNQIILQKFIQLIQAHHLNVSIISSKNTLWPNGPVMLVVDSALLLPNNNVPSTSSQLNKQVGKQWIADIKEVIEENKGIASFTTVSVDNGNVVQELTESTNAGDIPFTPSYLGILNVQHGLQGYIPSLPNWQTTYNFTIPTSDGKQQHIQVIAGNITVTLMEQTGSVTTNEIHLIEDIIPPIWMKYSHSSTTYITENIRDALHKQLPQGIWDVTISNNKVYIDAQKTVTLKVLDNYVTVFSLSE